MSIFFVLITSIGFASTVKIPSGGSFTIGPRTLNFMTPVIIKCEEPEAMCKLESDSTGFYVSFNGIKISKNFKEGLLARKKMTSLQQEGHCK